MLSFIRTGAELFALATLVTVRHEVESVLLGAFDTVLARALGDSRAPHGYARVLLCGVAVATQLEPRGNPDAFARRTPWTRIVNAVRPHAPVPGAAVRKVLAHVWVDLRLVARGAARLSGTHTIHAAVDAGRTLIVTAVLHGTLLAELAVALHEVGTPVDIAHEKPEARRAVLFAWWATVDVTVHADDTLIFVSVLLHTPSAKAAAVGFEVIARERHPCAWFFSRDLCFIHTLRK